MQERAGAIGSTTKSVDSKVGGLKTAKAGPLADTKAERAKLRPRATKVHCMCSALTKKVAEAEKWVEAVQASKKAHPKDAYEGSKCAKCAYRKLLMKAKAVPKLVMTKPAPKKAADDMSVMPSEKLGELEAYTGRTVAIDAIRCLYQLLIRTRESKTESYNNIMPKEGQATPDFIGMPTRTIKLVGPDIKLCLLYTSPSPRD